MGARTKYSATLYQSEKPGAPERPLISVAAIAEANAACPASSPEERRYRAGLLVGNQVGALFARALLDPPPDPPVEPPPPRLRRAGAISAAALGVAGIGFVTWAVKSENEAVAGTAGFGGTNLKMGTGLAMLSGAVIISVILAATSP
jgi:hypothetical protein